jgi:hypothetical protein
MWKIKEPTKNLWLGDSLDLAYSHHICLHTNFICGNGKENYMLCVLVTVQARVHGIPICLQNWLRCGYTWAIGQVVGMCNDIAERRAVCDLKAFHSKMQKKLWVQFLQMEPFCYHQGVVSSVSTYWWSSTHGQLMQCVGHAASCGLSENWNSPFACFISTFTTSFPAPCFLPDMLQRHIIQQLVLWSLTVVCMLRLDPHLSEIVFKSAIGVENVCCHQLLDCSGF